MFSRFVLRETVSRRECHFSHPGATNQRFCSATRAALLPRLVRNRTLEHVVMRSGQGDSPDRIGTFHDGKNIIRDFRDLTLDLIRDIRKDGPSKKSSHLAADLGARKMAKNEIINALIAGHLFAAEGKPFGPGEQAAAIAALKAVRFLPGPERVAIHEAVVAGAKFCAAA